ncbi:hypothetical protein VP01_2140g2 [Puccinia sorghi]|uniref:Uncharacterized protein n=1 Tax=Puccinia sorghi TaxID=27349 RepID=A0A0L6V9N4_9BASI|nr:hypothetical protein VP01_2140g2 [Puccinia sorghi]
MIIILNYKRIKCIVQGTKYKMLRLCLAAAYYMYTGHMKFLNDVSTTMKCWKDVSTGLLVRTENKNITELLKEFQDKEMKKEEKKREKKEERVERTYEISEGCEDGVMKLCTNNEERTLSTYWCRKRAHKRGDLNKSYVEPNWRTNKLCLTNLSSAITLTMLVACFGIKYHTLEEYENIFSEITNRKRSNITKIPDVTCHQVIFPLYSARKNCTTCGISGMVILLLFLTGKKTSDMFEFLNWHCKKKLAQLPAVDMQDAPAKLPSKLHMFSYVDMLEQSLCTSLFCSGTNYKSCNLFFQLQETPLFHKFLWFQIEGKPSLILFLKKMKQCASWISCGELPPINFMRFGSKQMGKLEKLCIFQQETLQSVESKNAINQVLDPHSSLLQMIEFYGNLCKVEYNAQWCLFLKKENPLYAHCLPFFMNFFTETHLNEVPNTKLTQLTICFCQLTHLTHFTHEISLKQNWNRGFEIYQIHNLKPKSKIIPVETCSWVLNQVSIPDLAPNTKNPHPLSVLSWVLHNTSHPKFVLGCQAWHPYHLISLNHILHIHTYLYISTEKNSTPAEPPLLDYEEIQTESDCKFLFCKTFNYIAKIFKYVICLSKSMRIKFLEPPRLEVYSWIESQPDTTIQSHTHLTIPTASRFTSKEEVTEKRG